MKLSKTLKSGKTILALFSIICCVVIETINPLNAQNDPIYLDPRQPVAARVADLLSRMTLDEKIGQMVQADLCWVTNREDIQTYGFGSMLSGGNSKPPGENTPKNWLNTINDLQSWALKTRLKIPLIYGIDAVHGHNDVLRTTIFPHHIGMGAAHNPELVEQAEQVTAQEVMATGIRWAFAPCIAVVQDERWGRTYEGYGQDPALVSDMAAASVKGFQGDELNSNSVLACTILQGIRDAVSAGTQVIFSPDGDDINNADDVVVVVSETPYAEYKGDRTNLDLSVNDAALIATAKASGAPVTTILLSGRPLILGAALESSDAFIAAWLPGTEGEGVADVLFGDVKPKGKLPREWPRNDHQFAANAMQGKPLFPLGYGLTY